MTEPVPKSLIDNPRVGAWLSFAREGRVLVQTGKVEIGQGITTALAQIVAEELDVGLDRIDVASGRTADGPNEGFTVGSYSVEVSGGALRIAASAARRLFSEAAAAMLQTTADDLHLDDGTFLKSGLATGVTYWSLASNIDLDVEAAPLASPKPHTAYRVVGQSVPQRNLVQHITGAAFIHDLSPDSMLHGAILRPPRHGARLGAIDRTAIEALPGVIALAIDGSLVGVVVDTAYALRHAVERASKHLTWIVSAEVPANPVATLQVMAGPWQISHRVGTPPSVTAHAHSARYERPFIAHASIGPSCALAVSTAGKLHVTTHSQGVFPLRQAIATALEIKPEHIHLEHVPGAGCFGHNGADDAAFEAAFLARFVPGRTVRVCWSRAEELCWSPCGSAMTTEIAAALDSDGRIIAFDVAATSAPFVGRPGSGGSPNLLGATYLERAHHFRAGDVPLAAGGDTDRDALPLYDLPNVSVRKRVVANFPIRTSSLRTLGSQTNVFAIESMIDELAELANCDALEFRLNHLSDERAKSVLRRVAQAAKWPAVASEESAIGLGFARYKNRAAYCAVAAEVWIQDRVRLRRVWACVDAGLAINPNGLANQIEGGIIQAASWTLEEALPFDGNGIAARDWSAYPILKFSAVPEVVVEIVGNTGRSLGVGEAAQGPTTAAIANAVARATGVRIRDLPLTRHKLIAAITRV